MLLKESSVSKSFAALAIPVLVTYGMDNSG